MRCAFRCLVVVVLPMLLLGGCSSVGTGSSADPTLSWFDASSVLSEADQALAAGRWQRAETLYVQVADGRPNSDARRARALWGAAVAEVGQPADERELGLARARLDALLSAYPERDEAAPAKALRALLAAPPESSSPPPAPAPPPQSASDERPESDATRALRLRVGQLEAKLAETRATLAEKEAALERLKQAIVGDG